MIKRAERTLLIPVEEAEELIKEQGLHRGEALVPIFACILEACAHGVNR